MAYNIIASQDLKDISKTDFGSDHDTLLDSVIIPAVGELLATYCGRPDWDKAARTEYFSFDACNRDTLFLASPPVYSSPAVALWEDTATPRVYGSDTALVNGTDFFVYEAEGFIEKVGTFARGIKTVKVTYTGGYLTANGTGAPARLKMAAMMQSKILFDRREEFGMSSRSLDGGSITMLSILTLPRQVTMLIDDLRIFRV